MDSSGSRGVAPCGTDGGPSVGRVDNRVSNKGGALYLTAAAALASAVLLSGCSSAPSQPSLLLVVIEGVRADHSSIYGYPRQTTPHLEALAQEGVVFEQAYSSTPNTIASLASIITGRFPPEHGAFLRPVLNDSVVTLAEALKGAGYATHAVSSEPSETTESGFFQGFESVDRVDPFNVSQNDGGADEVTKRAQAWLENDWDGSRPFFLMLVYSSTKLPFSPPEELKSKFQAVDENPARVEAVSEYWTPFAQRYDSGELDLSARELRILTGLYDAEIFHADAEVGSVISTLRKRRLLDNTLVVVTSNRGEDLGEAHRLADPTSLREANLKVPLLMRFPNKLKAGARVSGLVEDVDLLPTLCDLLGVKRPPTITASAVSLAVSDKQAGLHASRPYAVSVALRSLPGGVIQLLMSVRDGTHRLEVSPAGPTGLFDLSGEAPDLNILAKSPEIEKKLNDEIGEWDASLRPLPGSPSPPAAPAAPPAAAPAAPPAAAKP